uniref:Synaptobrevin, longin-like domain protein n=1 Tax=Tanacetum cinerariifolium TaxID=118510 RepID=A0A6L2P171_TANCI|nr:hypothetical protein [Tanacetum cinerariifolium]
MARLAFCDYHNTIAILEKSEHNFWSTARIETTNEGTKILATVDGKPRTIFESSIRRNLKLNDEEGISSLPDVELFENLALMGYNILPNQRFTFQKGQFSHQWKFLIHTIIQCLSPKSTCFNEFSSNIATDVGESSGTPTESHHTPSPQAQQSPHHDLSPSHPTASTKTIPIEIPTLRDDSQGEAFLTVTSLDAGRDRGNIIKTSALPYDSTPRVTSLDADEGSMQQQLQELMDLCIRLQRQQTKMATKTEAQDLEISSLKARIKLLEDKDKGSVKLSGDDALIKGRNAENILTSGVQAISVPPVAKVFTFGVPTGSGLVPTIVRDAKIARIHAEEELQMMIDGLDRNNEVIAKHLQEYEQSNAELTIGEKIELINELEQMEFYMSVLRSHSGWKTEHFGEEGERVNKKGLKLEHGSAKRMKTSENEFEEDIKEMMQLGPVEEVYVEALQVKHPIIDWEIHSEGQRDYWKIIRLGGHTSSVPILCRHAKAV